MIASLNIVAKMFAKIAKTFTELLATIMAIKRIPVLILHLEAKYGKMDCKNEIYMKNWIKNTWTAKSQPWEKVNGQPYRSQSQCLIESTAKGQSQAGDDINDNAS